jgi:pantetheine-phosphate adenylyltransferase
VIVLLAVNAGKNYMFTLEERVDMAKNVFAILPNVTVDTYAGYTAVYAVAKGADFILRGGGRSVSDFEQEKALADENREIGRIETLILPCLPSYSHISSSMVRAHIGADPLWETQMPRFVTDYVAQKVKEKYVLKVARKHWDSLMKDLGNPKESEQLFKEITAGYAGAHDYDGPHRDQHNLSHIVFVLNELEKVKNRIVDYNALRIGAWYHDIVNDPFSKGNIHIASDEERSALRLKDDAPRLGISEQTTASACAILMATRHTKPVSDSDGGYLADADLAIFGQNRNVFDEYEENIRKEYAHVPEATFCTRRAQILQMFLDRKLIYSTEYFGHLYEDTARKNLEYSIEQLKKTVGE